MGFALSAPAVQVVLHSTADEDVLAGWVEGVAAAGDGGRGLHSSTFQLNLSRF